MQQWTFVSFAMTCSACLPGLLFIIQSLLAVLCLSATSNVEMKDYCEGETFQGSCAHDEIIVTQRAFYGRMRLGRCVKVDMGYIGCSKNVLHLVDQRCSGKRHCVIRIPDSNLENTRPCLELKSYLEINYTCQKVIEIDIDTCRSQDYVRVGGKEGALSSMSTQETWCGTKQVPWLIQGHPGQRINISLLDFSSRQDAPQYPLPPEQQTHQQREGERGTVDICEKYGVIKDLAEPPKELDICGGRGRERHLLESASASVEILIENRRLSTGHFVVNYKIYGCGNPTVPNGMWFTRENDVATVGCNHSKETWTMRCEDDSWTGQFGNCSHNSSGDNMKIKTEYFGFLPNILLLVICVAASFLGLLVLIVIICATQRVLQRKKLRSSSSTATGCKPPPQGNAQKPLLLVTEISEECGYLRPDVAVTDVNAKRNGIQIVQYNRQQSLPQSLPQSLQYRTQNGVTYERGNSDDEDNNFATPHIWEMPLPSTP